MKKATNIPTWNYPSSGTPTYRDTSEVPPNIFRQGGFMTTPPTNPPKDYSTVPGVNQEKLQQWNSLGKEAPTNVKEAQLLAEAVGYTPHQAIVVAAQWALESAHGKKLGGDYNYFGIKSHNEAVRKRMSDKYGLNLSANKLVPTSEYEGGEKKAKEASFMNFENPIEAFLGHKAFLETNTRYNKALTETTSPAEFAEALQQAGYATSPTYAEKLGEIAKPVIGEEAYGKSKSLVHKPAATFDSVLYGGAAKNTEKGIEEYQQSLTGLNKPFQEIVDVELPKKKNLPVMSLKPGSTNFGQSIFTRGQTFNPKGNRKAYGGELNTQQNILSLQNVAESQEVELTPEQINYYKALGYNVEELD